MAKHLYNDFQLDFKKLNSEHIAVAMLKLFPYRSNLEKEYVWFNPLGTYIMWSDGGDTTYYFCRDYINISGWDLHETKDINQCIEYLKTI